MSTSPDNNEPLMDSRLQNRQMQVLRERNAKQQARIDAIMAAARGHQDLQLDMHNLAVELLAGQFNSTHDEKLQAPIKLIKTRFAIDHIALCLASQQHKFTEIDYSLLCQRVKHLGSVCDDRISAKLQTALFPAATKIGSCAFVPIVYEKNLRGVMVLGAMDNQRFLPNMGVTILDRLGQLIGAYFVGLDIC